MGSRSTETLARKFANSSSANAATFGCLLVEEQAAHNCIVASQSVDQDRDSAVGTDVDWKAKPSPLVERCCDGGGLGACTIIDRDCLLARSRVPIKNVDPKHAAVTRSKS